MSDSIEIEQLSVDCRVGVYPAEYQREQSLVFCLQLHLSLEEFARAQVPRDGEPILSSAGTPAQLSIDYTCVIEQLQFIATSRHWGLIESLGFALVNWLLLPVWPAADYAQVERLRLRITKPNACAGSALPSVVIERDKAWHSSVKQEVAEGVTHELVVASPEVRIARLQLRPGASYTLPRASSALECRRPLPGGGFGEGPAKRAVSEETLRATSRSEAWLLVSAD